ncbi:MAG: hypothetical protein MJZ35_08790, partial [Bacteroidaceae bacterium]|nr:hypothetical protein [Bacteroidaceae bacterium]
MKKTILMLTIALLSCVGANAQRNRQRMSDEDRAKQRAEQIQKQSESMAKTLGIKDDAAKTAFIEKYVAYQTELQSSMNMNFGRMGGDDDKKPEKMTDEECFSKIKDALEMQEQQATSSAKRLEVTKKYLAEFMQMLTPQQLVQIFAPSRGNFGGGGGRGGFGGGGFGGGMPGGGFGGGGG